MLDMKKAASSILFLTLVLAAGKFQATDGFVPISVNHRSSLLSLQLIPGQGNQLVAAYNAATCKKIEDGQEQEANKEEETAGGETIIQLVKPSAPSKADDEPSSPASQSLASRIFSLPSALIGNRKSHKKSDKNDDIVLYPLVGFKLVHHDEKVIALPTKSHVACRLPVSSRKDEDVYGWYSPSCSLNLYAQDISENPSSSK